MNLNTNKGVITLMYHRFNENKYPSTNIKIEVFEEQIKEIYNSKIKFLNFKNFEKIIESKLDNNYLLLTIDDAFQSFYLNAWPILKAKNIPFILWHKEATKYTKAIMETNAKFYAKRMSWLGKDPILGDIIVRDYQERDTILMAGLCKEKNIHVIGTIRYDRIYKLDKSNKIKKPRCQVTLFSPMLILPGMDCLPQNIGRNVFNPKDGIVEYFYKLHGAIAELASQNPDTDFIIKPKWEKNWVKLIP